MSDARAERLRDGLLTVLSARLGRPVEVEVPERLSGGASRETWSFLADLDGAAGTLRRFVVQRERPGGLRSGGMDSEGRLLAAAARAGAPVAEVIATDDGDTAVLGGPFLVMAHVEGETIPRRLLRDEAFAAARAGLARQAGAALAAIHRIPPSSVDGLARPEQVGQFRDLLDQLGEPHPAFEIGLRRLEADRPPEVPAAVVHGDFRTGNLLVAPDGLRAVLDWELAHLGDPAEDLGWFCVRAWRFGSPHRAGGFGPVDELLAGYAEAGGDPPDPDRLRWWEAMGTLKWGVMCILQASTHLHGLHRSVELAAIGRRAAENEEDLLHLLAGPDPYEPVAATGADPRPAPYGRPAAGELLEAVEEYLGEVREGVEGRLGFHARVAANAVALVRRELELGPVAAGLHAGRLAALGAADDAELAAAIRAGDHDHHLDDVMTLVRASVRDALAVANPGYWEDHR